MFTGMMDQQLAQNISSKGIGLASMMVKQLSPQTVSEKAQSGQVGSGKFAPLNPPTVLHNTHSSASVLPSAYNDKTQQDFVNRMLPHALQAAQSSGVPPQLMLGQAALESGWGKREIHLADGSNSYNLFGIKAGANWHGKTTDVVTTEYQQGVAHKQIEKFRAYASYQDAFHDYAHLLSNNPRYAPVMQQAGDALGMAQALQKSGYATDPKYAEKLAQVMGKMNIPT